jgi:rubrerythrin
VVRIRGHAGLDRRCFPDAGERRDREDDVEEIGGLTMDAQTHENVLAAMRGEAFAHARYLLFASAARKRGSPRLASMFEGIAAVELQEHFAELAELAGLVGTDADNVRAAISDENIEVEARYPQFAEQALAAGEFAIAERFAEMVGDEREHEKALELALEGLEVPA